MARAHHTVGKPFTELRESDSWTTSGAKTDSRAYRKAEYLTVPGASQLGEYAGTSIGAGPGELGSGKAWTAPSQEKFGTSKTQSTHVTASKWDEAFNPAYEKIYYTDMFDAAKDFYFRERTPQQIMEETDPSYEGKLPGEAAILPHQSIYDYAYGVDSPYRNLQDIKESQGELLGEYAEGIETEEEAIDKAKELYKEKESAFEDEKTAQVASGISTEQSAQASIAKQGYEIGPAEKQLGLAEEAGDVEMGKLYQRKRMAQEDRQSDITKAVENIETMYEDAETAYGEIEDADYEYGGMFQQGSQFWQQAKDVVDASKFRVAEVQSATDAMYANAVERAKNWSGAHPYRGSGPLHWKESSGMRSERDEFSSFLDTVQTNINDLASFFPSAENIGGASVAPYLEGGDFSWLGEGFDPEAYSYDD